MKFIGFKIEDDLHKRFKLYCTTNGTDMTSVLLRLINKEVGGGSNE